MTGWVAEDDEVVRVGPDGIQYQSFGSGPMA